MRSEFERRDGAVLKLADVKYTKSDEEKEDIAMSVDDLDLINMFNKRLDEDFPDDEDEKRELRNLFSEVYKKAEVQK